MKFLDRIVRWIQPFAIPNLTIGIIAVQFVIYFMSLSNPGVLENCKLIPAKVYEGEVWRLLSFLFMPPGGMLMFVLLAWWMFHFFGGSLERYWGKARFNLYFLIGYLSTIACAFIVPNSEATIWFFYSSFFLAFAYLFPDVPLMLFFILPVKVKWLGLMTWIGLAFGLISGNAFERLAIIAAVLNFLLFFTPDIIAKIRQQGRQAALKGAQLRQAGQPRHTCTICKITDISHPKMDFRYCSKCAGAPCYCAEHIKDHVCILSDEKV